MHIGTVGIWWNDGKAGAPRIARRLTDALEARGVHVRMDERLAGLLSRPDCAFSARRYGECDMIAVLGGDGTLLWSLDAALPDDKPLLGINLGHMGFLSEVEPDDIESDIARLVNGDFTLDSRMLLEATAPGFLAPPALNEIAFTRAPGTMRILPVEVWTENALVERFSGDGLIVATPTGSTAYSFSAGGPVLSPELEAMVVTPICPHTPHSRPIVLPPSARIEVRVPEGDAQVAVDGRYVVKAPGLVSIARPERRARFVRLHERGFFELLRQKLTQRNQ